MSKSETYFMVENYPNYIVIYSSVHIFKTPDTKKSEITTEQKFLFHDFLLS